MNKKFFVSLAIILCAIFSFTVCFATNNMDGLGNAANDVRNVVGGVENTVENAAMDVSNTSKNVTGDVENGMNRDKNRNNNSTMGITNDNNGRYSTSRVNTGNGTVMGMTSTAWTWLILGIAAIAIIAVVWYYSMQFTNNNNHHNDE